MLEEHSGYLTDEKRTAAYRQALATTLTTGDVVADLGCGTGIFGLLSLQAGAARVYEIESARIIDVARETFKRAGCAERVQFVRGSTFRVELPERVDVLVCDHIGYFGFDYGLFRLLNDARARFLKPGGRIVPGQVTLHLAPAEAPEAWAKAAPWSGAGIPDELRWLDELSLNSKHAVTLDPHALLAPAFASDKIDFHCGAPEVVKLAGRFKSDRAGVMHGLAGFFTAELCAGVTITNAPGAAQAIARPQAFLPLLKPVPVAAGDLIEVSVTARPDDELIAWEVNIPARASRFRQSTFMGELFGVCPIAGGDPAQRPVPRRDAAARSMVLSYCDGIRSAAEITAAVCHDHPHLMPTVDELHRLVARVLADDTQ